MMFYIREGCSELTKYLTSRLAVEDIVWSSLFLREESSNIEDIKHTIVETNKIYLSDEKVDWLLRNCTRRFRKLENKSWELTAWHARKNSSFYEKAEAVLRLSFIPLPSDDLANLLNRSSVSGTATADIVDGFLCNKKDIFEKYGSYWFLKEWTTNKAAEDTDLLRIMIGRNNEPKIAGAADLRQICKSMLNPLNAAINVEDLRWALNLVNRKINLNSVFASGLLEPVCGGYWVPYELIPELIWYFNDLAAPNLEEYEMNLKEILKTGYAKFLEVKNKKLHGTLSTENTINRKEIVPIVPKKENNIPEVHPLRGNGTDSELNNSRLKRDDQQNRIIYAPSSLRQLVLAPPGSGKTEVVARKLAFLLSEKGGLKPRQILVLSFSRSAVKVLMDRIRMVTEEGEDEYDDLRHIAVRTFDSWTYRLLRFIGYQPQQLLQNLPFQDSYIRNINRLVNDLKIKENQKKLVAEGGKLSNIRHIIVDECQDLSGPRADLVKILLFLLAPPSTPKSKPFCGFTLLGDMNQAIYDWTMDDYPDSLTSKQLIEQIKSNYRNELEEVNFLTNHRSSSELGALINRAQVVINNKSTLKMTGAQKIFQMASETFGDYTLEDIGKFLEKPGKISSFAILCRKNDEAMFVAHKIKREFNCDRNIRFILDVGDPPLNLPPWIAFMLGHFTGNEITKSNFMRLYSKYKPPLVEKEILPDANYMWKLLAIAYQGEEGKESTSLLMDQLREKLLWRDALPDDEGIDEKQVVFTNIHRSKGQEFNSVVLVNSFGDGHGDEDQDEAKVAYVGISRAKEYLYMLENPDTKRVFSHSFGHGEGRYKRICRFEKEDNWLNYLEIGIPGDIDVRSFISSDIHGSDEKVEQVQKFLFNEQNNIVGQKLKLVKKQNRTEPGKFVYEITLEYNGKEMTLGQTTGQLSRDLAIIKPHGSLRYPNTIEDLYISQVTTILETVNSSEDMPEPWKTSGLWLGITMHGIGTFRFHFGNS